jgi:hypothetical protein
LKNTLVTDVKRLETTHKNGVVVHLRPPRCGYQLPTSGS